MVRKSNFELLRIISMILIIIAHYVYHGGLLFSSTGGNYLFASIVKPGGNLGVICFVFISAYFSRKFSIKSILKISFQTIFVSLIFNVTFLELGGGQQARALEIILSPISGVYWFVKSFIFMLLLIPLVNIFIERNFKWTIIISFSLFSVIPTLYVFQCILNNRILFFVTLYIIASKLNDLNKLSIKTSIVIFMGALAFIYLPTWFNGDLIERFDDIQSPFMILAAVALFRIFSLYNVQSVIINRIANVTFICYLLHDNPSIRTFLWNGIFQTQMFYQSATVIVVIHILICLASIYISAFIVELVYEKTFGKILKCKWIETACTFIDTVYNNFILKITSLSKEKSNE